MNEATPDDAKIRPEEVLKLFALGLLYFVQGLPFGYQAHALPVMLREQGESLTVIALSQVLALPWMLKIFAGPYIDTYGDGPLGRRKSFILPLQLALVATLAAASMLPIERSLALLCLLLLVMNVFTATMDVAVDGLAVDVLRPRTLGLGNGVQVAGFRLGMTFSGGVLLHYLPEIGLRTLFAILAGTALFVHAVTWVFPEGVDDTRKAARVAPDVRATFVDAWRALRAPSSRAVVIFVLVYKAGEAMADSVFRPMLVDAGVSSADIALYVNTYGSTTALVGPMLAGVVASRIGLRRALLGAIVLRVIPIVGELAIASGVHDGAFVLGVTLLEHLVGAAVTTLAFALMMSVTDPHVGATQFTALATLEVIGKGFLGYLAGPIGDHAGLVTTYAIAAALTIAFALVAPRLVDDALAARPA